MLAISVLNLALAPSSYGTSVLVIETAENSVYLAADGLQSESASGFTRQFCKIKKQGTVYWAVATNFYYHRTTGFDVEKLVASIGTSGSVHSMMKRFNQVATGPLAREVASLKTEDPTEYAEYIAGTRFVVEIAFVGRENGEPTWAVTRFRAKKVGTSVTVTGYLEKRLDPPSATGLGHWDLGAHYVVDHPTDFYSNPTGTIRRGLLREAVAGPKDVAEPFSILVVDSHKDEWLEPGLCSK